MNRRTAVLGVLLLALLGWMAGRAALSGGPSAAGAPSAASEKKPAAKKGKGAITADSVPVVVAGLARARAVEPFERERSLFTYAKSPEEIRAEEDARRKAEEAAKKAAEEAAARAAKAAEEAAKHAKIAQARAEEERKKQEEWLRLNPPKPTPPSFPYQYVGTIGPMDDPYAILSGTDREFRYVRTGEEIDGKFRLEFIGEARLDLSYSDARFADQFTQVTKYESGAATAAKSR